MQKLTMHLGFANLRKAVAYDHSITNYMNKMTANRIFKLVSSIFITRQQIFRTYWKS